MEEIKIELQKQKDLVGKLIGRLEFHESRWRHDVKTYEAQIIELNAVIDEIQLEKDCERIESKWSIGNKII
jgi:hypothetical protein